jgi:hypothetical protein
VRARGKVNSVAENRLTLHETVVVGLQSVGKEVLQGRRLEAQCEQTRKLTAATTTKDKPSL